jgi:hypothetical protein
MLLIAGATALARGLYLQRQLTEQLDTGAMGAIRSWVMWSTTDGRELVAWYRQITPWLIGGGSVLLLMGTGLALWDPTIVVEEKAGKLTPRSPKKKKKG